MKYCVLTAVGRWAHEGGALHPEGVGHCDLRVGRWIHVRWVDAFFALGRALGRCIGALRPRYGALGLWSALSLEWSEMESTLTSLGHCARVMVVHPHRKGEKKLAA